MIYGADGREYRRLIGFRGGMAPQVDSKNKSGSLVDCVGWKEVDPEVDEVYEAKGEQHADDHAA